MPASEIASSSDKWEQWGGSANGLGYSDLEASSEVAQPAQSTFSSALARELLQITGRHYYLVAREKESRNLPREKTMTTFLNKVLIKGE